MANQDSLSFGNYNAFLTDPKTRIRQAQVKAALAVNKELILLYWQIGWEILTRQQQAGWGAKVIERLARNLNREFPDMKGFSRTNLMYMRAFAEAWPDDQPTMGIILCKSKNKTIAEYALSSMKAPIAVATHSLPEDLKSSLPTIEQLESELEAAVNELEGDSE